MLVLVGLGNPKAKHASNRHNIGFMAVDEIARAQNFPPPRKQFAGELRQDRIANVKTILFKPQTYMNESGQAVGELLRFFKLSPGDIYVFHDELDLAPGKFRFKTGGGTAGHNGLRSIARHIGPDFHRFRVGIGHPGHKDRVYGYVLKDFTKVERAWVDKLTTAIGEHIPALVTHQPSTFMNKVHLAVNPPAAKTADKKKKDGGKNQQEDAS